MPRVYKRLCVVVVVVVDSRTSAVWGLKVCDGGGERQFGWLQPVGSLCDGELFRAPNPNILCSLFLRY